MECGSHGAVNGKPPAQGVNGRNMNGGAHWGAHASMLHPCALASMASEGRWLRKSRIELLNLTCMVSACVWYSLPCLGRLQVSRMPMLGRQEHTSGQLTVQSAVAERAARTAVGLDAEPVWGVLAADAELLVPTRRTGAKLPPLPSVLLCVGITTPVMPFWMISVLPWLHRRW